MNPTQGWTELVGDYRKNPLSQVPVPVHHLDLERLMPLIGKNTKEQTFPVVYPSQRLDRHLDLQDSDGNQS